MCPSSDSSPSYWLSLDSGQIPVYRKGNGKQLLIALHGFESSGHLFESWTNILGKKYTICSPDLPFHGQAKWKKRTFNRADILALILAIVQREQADHFTLAGFSMGARFSICLADSLEEYVNQYILLAPAGIGSYDKVIPLPFQRIAEWALQRPGWFKLGAQLLHKIGWLSRFHLRYAEVQVFPKDKRFRLFRVFNSILDFKTSTSQSFNFWQTNNTATLVILATRDRMVPNDKIKTYFSKHPNCNIIEVDDKHEMNMEIAAKIILKKVE